MKPIIAIDPGTFDSAFVCWNSGIIGECAIVKNEELSAKLRSVSLSGWIVAVEMVACYGMPVGKEVFETCLFIGRIQEICSSKSEFRLVYRKDIKLHHCGIARAKDANVAQALRDKYGEKGTKENPGRTYRLKSHLWQAFALATYVSETQPA